MLKIVVSLMDVFDKDGKKNETYFSVLKYPGSYFFTRFEKTCCELSDFITKADFLCNSVFAIIYKSSWKSGYMTRIYLYCYKVQLLNLKRFYHKAQGRFIVFMLDSIN